MAYSQCRHPKYIIYIIKLEFLEHFYNFKVSQGQKHSCINNTPKKKKKRKAQERSWLLGSAMEKRKCFWMMGYGVMQSILTKPATWTLTRRAADRVNHAGPTLGHWLLPWGSDAQLCPFRHPNVGPVGSKETRLRLRSNSPFIYRKFKISNSQNNII